MQDPLTKQEQRDQIHTPAFDDQKETEELPKGTRESVAETEEHPRLRTAQEARQARETEEADASAAKPSPTTKPTPKPKRS